MLSASERRHTSLASGSGVGFRDQAGYANRSTADFSDGSNAEKAEKIADC